MNLARIATLVGAGHQTATVTSRLSPHIWIAPSCQGAGSTPQRPTP